MIIVILVAYYWSLLDFVGYCWCPLVTVGYCWLWLVSVGLCSWSMSAPAGYLHRSPRGKVKETRISRADSAPLGGRGCCCWWLVMFSLGQAVGFTLNDLRIIHEWLPYLGENHGFYRQKIIVGIF